MAITKISTPELFDFSATNTALQLPTGTTLQRPTSPSTGEWRFNTTNKYVEYWDGVAWFQIATESNACVSDEVDIFGDNSGVALYQLNWDGSDMSGNYDGTTTNVSFSNGKIDEAANFNGSSSQLNLPTSFNTDIIDATGAFTLSMWIKMNDITAVQYLFASNISNNVDLGVNSNALGAGKVIWTIYNGSYAQIISTTTITTSVWYNIVVKYNNGTSELFIDNVSQGTMTKTLIESSIVPTIGYRNTGSGNYTNGLIDQVRVFNKAISAISPNEVSTLYAEAACVKTCTTDTPQLVPDCIAYYKLDGNADDSNGTATVYDGTPTNVSWTQGRFGSAGGFNGSSSFIDTNAKIPASLDFSVSFWIKSSDTSSGTHFLFSTKGSYTTNGWFIENSSGYLVYGEGNGVDNATSQTSPSIIADGIWNHVVVTREAGGTVNMYINNSRVITDGSVGTYFMTSSTWAYDTHIGRYSLNSQLFYNGDLDQIRIYDEAITAEQVTTLYNEVACPSGLNFNTVIYTGTGTSGGNTLNVGGVGFQPDLVWVKNRTTSINHYLYDSVRGTGAAKALHSNTTSSESTASVYTANGGVETITNEGLVAYRGTDNTYQGTNMSGQDYVAWCWKAGGAASANIEGTLASQVSVNQDAGFSIVSFTSNGAASVVSTGHGLDVTPELVIWKNRDDISQWPVYHKDLGFNGRLQLEDSVAVQPFTPFFDITSTTIAIRQSSLAANNNKCIAYCFHSVAGYQKIGSYIGSGTTSKVVSGLGFTPSFVMIKRTDSSGVWVMLDNKRVGSYPNSLYANSSAAEDVTQNNSGWYPISFSSGQFELLQPTGDYNAGGTSNYIYMAFA